MHACMHPSSYLLVEFLGNDGNFEEVITTWRVAHYRQHSNWHTAGI